MLKAILEVKGEEVLVRPEFYPSTAFRQLGMTWDGRRRAWVAPASRVKPQAVEALCERLGIELEIRSLDPEQGLWDPDWAREHSLEQLRARSERGLFGFQEIGVRFLVANRGALLAFAPGLGKTATSITAAAEKGHRLILVVSPLSLLRNWEREIRRWDPRQPEVIRVSSKARWPQQLPGLGDRPVWIVTNYDTVRVTADFPPWLRQVQLVILDESILVKNREAERTKKLMMLFGSRYAETLLSHQRKKRDQSDEEKDPIRFFGLLRGADRWLLSGAPMTRSFADLWAQLHLIDPLRFPSFWRFVETYCIVQQSQWGTEIVGTRPGALEEFRRRNMDLFLAYPQEVLDLPDWVIQDRDIEMEEKQAEMYEEMALEFRTWLHEYDPDALVAPNVLAQVTRLIQLASSPILLGASRSRAWPKLDAATEILETYQGPFVIWTVFIKSAQEACVRLERKGFRVASLTGATPERERQEIVDRFQGGQLDVIVAHPGVGKYGLTLTRARVAIYLEKSWNFDDFIQSLHRIRRIGTAHTPLVIHLHSVRPEYGGHTVDHLIYELLEKRKQSLERLTVGELRELWDSIHDGGVQ
jgi:SNF2 family DNA or RNA helicase